MAKKRKLEGNPSPSSSSSSSSSSGASQEPTSLPEDSPSIEPPSAEPSWPSDIPEPLLADHPNPETLEPPNPSSSSAADEEKFDDDDDDGPASLQKLLEPFSKEQVIDLLRDAALKHPDVWSSIKRIADSDPAHRKVFVHGLGWNATAETLLDSFRDFGEIEDCNAIVDKITGRSKGYGFILFKHRSGARRALMEPQKKIGNKMTACQLASEGPPPPAPVAASAAAAAAFAPSFFLPASEYTQRKIYVSNAGADLDPQKVLQFFAKFGEIEEGPLGLDKATGKLKGFCLFVYKSVESAKKALEEPHKNFEGHILHCQRAIDGPKVNKQGGHLFHGGGGGGQYAGLQQQGKIGFGAQGVQFASASSTVAGPGHLIAPPAVSMRFNQAGQANAAAAAGYNPALGLAVKNGGLGATSAFGNQVRGAGGYMKPGVVGGYGASLRIHGSYGNAAVGQGSAWNQQGFSHTGGVGSSMGQ